MAKTEYNEAPFYSMPNIYSKYAYLQGLDLKISYKKEINIFEQMDINESIYKGVLEKHSKEQLYGKIPTMLVSAINIQEKPPHITTTLIREVVLESAKQEI